MAQLKSQLVLSILDNVSGPAKRIQGMLRGLRDTAKSQMGMFGGLTGQMAMLTGGAASIYGVAQGFKAAVSSAADFQTAMNRVNALSGATTAQMSAMRQQALELGRTTMFTASQAGDAQGFLAMAGFKANDIMAAMPGTLQLATAAQMDLARTADVVTNILTGYNMEVSELGRVNDVLVKAFTSANVDLSMLAESMKYAGPIATSAGIQFEEATAALSLMGNAGIQGSMAGTSLRGAMTRVLNPTKAIRKAMKQAGLSFTDAEGRLLPLADIVERLEPHVEDTGLFMEIFGQRAGPAMAALVTQGSRKLRELDRELRNSGGTAERVANVQMQGFNGRMLEMRSALEGLMIALGDRIIPRITPIVEKLTRVFGELNTFVESLASRISVFDKMQAAFEAFAVGMGGTGFTAWLQETGAAWRDSIFGTVSDEGDFEAANNLARISNEWRKIGKNFRAFIEDMSVGNLTTALGSLWDAFKEMPTGGKMAAMWAAATGIKMLAASLTILVTSPWMRAVAALYGIATVIELFKDAETFNEFIGSLKELSAIDWVGIAAGLALVAAPIWRILSGIRGINAAGGVKSVTNGAGGKGKPGFRPPTTPRAPVGGLLGGMFGGSLLSVLMGTVGGKVTIGAIAAYAVDRLAASYRDVIGDGWFVKNATVGDGGYAPFSGGASPRDAERESMDAWRRYRDSGNFQDDMDDRIVPTLEQIREQVGMAPMGTHDVREINPTPVHAPINVTVYATTNADPNAIASQVSERVQSALAGHYSDGAYYG